MTRPCFVVIDREFPGSISTRKLVLETAKFNVLTAYSGHEALDMLGRFPAVDGIVIDSNIEDVSPQELVQSLKGMAAKVPVIMICSPLDSHGEADFRVNSFQPAELLETIRAIRPRESKEIIKREEELNQEGKRKA